MADLVAEGLNGVAVEAGEAGVPVAGNVDDGIVDAVAEAVAGGIGIGRSGLVVGEKDINFGVAGRGLHEADAEGGLVKLEHLPHQIPPRCRQAIRIAVEDSVAVGIEVPAVEVVEDLAAVGVVAAAGEVVAAGYGAGGLPVAHPQVVGQALQAGGGGRGGGSGAAEGRGRGAAGGHLGGAAGAAGTAPQVEAAVDRIKIDARDFRVRGSRRGCRPLLPCPRPCLLAPGGRILQEGAGLGDGKPLGFGGLRGSPKPVGGGGEEDASGEPAVVATAQGIGWDPGDGWDASVGEGYAVRRGGRRAHGNPSLSLLLATLRLACHFHSSGVTGEPASASCRWARRVATGSGPRRWSQGSTASADQRPCTKDSQGGGAGSDPRPTAPR